MTVGVLFGTGIFFIVWGIFVLRSNKMKKDVERAENAVQGMISELEQTARIILAEIDSRSEENRKILEEGTVLLQRIERIKDENISTISGNRLLQKQREIERMISEGYDIADIAKSMDMGQGELQLIMDLGRGGNSNA